MFLVDFFLRFTNASSPRNCPSEEPFVEDLKSIKDGVTQHRAELNRSTDECNILKNSHGVLRKAASVKYAFIQAHRDEFRLMSMCLVLNVHRSGYFAWLKTPLSPRAIVNEKVSNEIRHLNRLGIYGRSLIFTDLIESSVKCYENRVVRLMRAAKLRSISGYKSQRYKVGKPSLVDPDQLQRQFT